LQERWQHLYNDIDLDVVCPRMEEFAQKISAKQGVLENVWAFIDGTFKSLARPSSHQEQFYNGKEREHGIKFQSVTTPDGIIRMFWGPCFGLAHDARLLRESQLVPKLAAYFDAAGGPVYHIFGDVAYPLSLYLLRGFKGNLSDEQVQFNKAMSSVRISVEWGFGRNANLWQALEFKRKRQLLQSAVSTKHQVATLLSNCLTCLRPASNQTSLYFNCLPETLAEYLRPRQDFR